MKVIKRDGRVVDYDKTKIKIAVEKANTEVGKKEENDEKVIYEMQTNFAQNSKAKKWSYLYELIEKYK